MKIDARIIVEFQCGKLVLAPRGWIRTSDHSISSQLLFHLIVA